MRWKKYFFPLLLAAGLVFTAGSLWWSFSARRQPAYRMQDVVTTKPILAVQGLPGGIHYAIPVGQGDFPRLEISPAYFDFGRIAPDQAVEHTFVLRNRGSADLFIRRAYTTCECTRAEFSASVIPPGKIALVRVQYDPRIHGAPGATLRRGVVIESNDPENIQSELWVQASLK